MSETVTITALGHSGDGVAEAGGERLYVPLTLPGEVVEIERDLRRIEDGQLLRFRPEDHLPKQIGI